MGVGSVSCDPVVRPSFPETLPSNRSVGRRRLQERGLSHKQVVLLRRMYPTGLLPEGERFGLQV